jgi:hypothetical protein
MRTSHPFTLLAAALVVAAVGCGQKKAAATRSGLETLDGTLAPAAFAAALRKAGGGHLHATALFHVDTGGKAEPGDGKPASPSAVTTTTDLWMDKQGSFRLVENNDQDGGREIVRVGGEVAVALRYGKMIRRAAQDSENARFLAEALGAPWAAWEIVRRQVEVDDAGQGAYRLRQSSRLVDLPAEFPAAEGLRKWRDTVDVKTLEGQATVDPGSHLPLAFACKTAFQAVRDELPVAGEVNVAAALDQVGKVADIAMPESEPLHVRQRTILDERALLGGLGASRLGSSLAPSAKKPGP